jgi:hypothetical protein
MPKGHRRRQENSSLLIHAFQEQSESADSSKQILTEMLEQLTAERDEMKTKSAKRKAQNLPVSII